MLCDAAGNAKRAFRVIAAGSYGMEACMERKEQTTGQGRLQYEIVSGTAVLTGYGGRDTSVVIPESVDGFPVVWIGKKAFLSNKTLRRIGLPDTLRGHCLPARGHGRTSGRFLSVYAGKRGIGGLACQF